MRTFRSLLFTALAFVAGSACAGNPAYDRIVDDTVARYRLPGLAVGVIEDGKVVYARTTGALRVGRGDAVTSRSIFKIASNSKAMTASVLARLVDQGKLRWDDPVVKYLPGFRMHDPWVTQHMLVRDLLVHNSGLPEGGGDLMLWPEPNLFTRQDIVAGLAYIKPAYGFRAGYAYDNLLYVVAGQVAAAAGGAPYETLVQREIFQPLGMSRCRVGAFDRDAVGDIAQPHVRVDGRYRVGDNADPAHIVPIASAPAGGIRCSLDDMLAWMGNWLAPDARQRAWLSQEQRAQMWLPRTPMPVSARRKRWDGTHVYAYGYGFRMADVDGQWTVSHTGTLSGMYSMMLLLPDRRSGFVFMINGDADDARTVLGEVLLKHFTAPRSQATVATYADEIDAAERAKPVQAPKAKPVRVAQRTPVSAPFDATRTGTWRDPWFGVVRVCPAGDRLRFVSEKSPLLRGTLVAEGDRWRVDWDEDRVDLEAWVDFKGRGADRRMTLAKVDPDGDFSFDYEDLAFARTGDCPR